jgi:hypothetical protein
MVDKRLLRSLPTQGLMERKVSTKLIAVVENLKIATQDSKR